MTSQLVIFRAFFSRPPDPKSEKKSRKSTKKNSGLICVRQIMCIHAYRGNAACDPPIRNKLNYTWGSIYAIKILRIPFSSFFLKFPKCHFQLDIHTLYKGKGYFKRSNRFTSLSSGPSSKYLKKIKLSNTDASSATLHHKNQALYTQIELNFNLVVVTNMIAF